jgi:hypothetical protein
MTFDRLAALQAEWRRRPPAHWLIASYLKYKPPAEVSAKPADRMGGHTIAELRSRFPGRVMKIGE